MDINTVRKSLALEGLTEDDVAAALSVLRYYGGGEEDSPVPEAALAGAILAALGSRTRREAEARGGVRRREASERIQAELDAASRRAQVRAAVLGHGHYSISTRHS